MDVCVNLRLQMLSLLVKVGLVSRFSDLGRADVGADLVQEVADEGSQGLLMLEEGDILGLRVRTASLTLFQENLTSLPKRGCLLLGLLRLYLLKFALNISLETVGLSV